MKKIVSIMFRSLKITTVGVCLAISGFIVPAEGVNIKVDPTTPCCELSVPGATIDLHSQKSIDFFKTYFVNPSGGTGGFDILLNNGPTIVVEQLSDTTLGEYRGFSGGQTDKIYIDVDLVNKATWPDTDYSSYLKALELLEATIAHETAHWVDFSDNGTNNNPAGGEDGEKFEMAVYGKIKDWSNVTGNPNVVPEPISSILFVTGGAVFASKALLKNKKKKLLRRLK